MKNKILYLAMCLLFTAIGLNLNAQVVCVPGGAVGTSSNTFVGIGTCTPAFKLHLVTNNAIPGDGINNGIRIEQTGPHGAVLGLYNTAAGLGGHNWALISTNSANTQGAGKLLFYDYSNAQTRMCINPGGLVNIGTTTPTSNLGTKLQVHGGAIMVSGPNSNGGPMVLFSDNTATHPNGRWGIEYVPNKGLNFWKPFNPGSGGGTNYHMFIKDDGKVGIGIDPDDFTPLMPNSMPNGYKLFVREGILTEALTIAPYGTIAWADYVFDGDYRRNTLAYVEEYIKENKHLPNVPSSDEVAKEGIDVAKMDATLLRQIEELWLHVIDLKKENQELRSQIDHH